MTNTGRYIRAVLWDMDGTLMDSQPLWDESFRNCCRERGGTVTPEQVAGIAGASIARTCELIAETGATASPQDPATAEVFTEISARVEAAGASVGADNRSASRAVLVRSPDTAQMLQEVLAAWRAGRTAVVLTPEADDDVAAAAIRQEGITA